MRALIRELAIPQTYTAVNGACGPACIRAIFAYYGFRTTDATIAARAGLKPSEGMTLAQLQGAANTYGVEPWLIERARPRTIADASDEGCPVLAHVRVPLGGGASEFHAVVVTAIDDREVVYLDPRGYRVLRTLDGWRKLRHRPDRAVDVLVFPAGILKVRELPKRLRRES